MVDLTLSPDQKQALDSFEEFLFESRSKFVLGGPAGSGKSTLTRLLSNVAEENGYSVQRSATTHKAKQVLGKDAETIHALLGLIPAICINSPTGRRLRRSDRHKVIYGSVIIVDEASMVDTEILAYIDDFADERDCRFVLVGDHYQLPPVSEKTCPVFELEDSVFLETVHRQREGSPILELATIIREMIDGGPAPVLQDVPGVIDLVDREEYERLAIEEFKKGGDALMVAWRNATVIETNKVVRRGLFGPKADESAVLPGERLIANATITHFEEVLLSNNEEVVAEKVKPECLNVLDIEVPGLWVELESDKGIFFVPDDMVQVRSILKEMLRDARHIQTLFNKGDKRITDEYRKAVWVDYFKAEETFADLRPSYCCTVHKSQGSSVDTVFIDAADISEGRNLWLNLMYVAVSRARKRLVIVGADDANFKFRNHRMVETGTGYTLGSRFG